MASTEPPRLAVRSPADLLAAVPYLLGFHPADSVVVVAMRGRRVVFAARADLPDPAEDQAGPARHLASVVQRQRADAATVVGYGPVDRATPAVDAVRGALGEAGLVLLDALRVTDGRWWSYLCAEAGCCPAEGRPYEPGTSEVSASAVYAGQVALPDRGALVAQVAPVDGPARVAMRRATAAAEQRLARLLPPTGEQLDEGQVRTAGVVAVREAMRRQRRGERLSDDEVAWLSLLLTRIEVRDHAWERTDGRDRDIALWTDVLRRAEPDLIAAPASLLAFAAWRAGQGALAAVALERALAEHPDYSLALLLDDLLRRGVPPSELDGWPLVGSPGVVRSRKRRRRPSR
ncbi:DUF4192 domain-containing protein [Micromonospora avicenniae]|uniref:DUF4192 domain-containing protein n=1 Tax=Micromonospora avicenniae TaxID=1198245 RepID=A0A1N6TM96_9ACTN|nr:DUF4192 domain-containing protein [Micromonospora avicenniae]SIQ54453.1 protein of unknown function [Micromonospora avicenniae]